MYSMFPFLDPFLMYKIINHISAECQQTQADYVNEMNIMTTLSQYDRSRIYDCIDHLIGYGWATRPRHPFPERVKYISEIDYNRIP
jgi:hypothetical protein